MEKLESYHINIWDDYYEKDNLPEGEKQETFIYVEEYEIPHEERKKCLEILLNCLKNNILNLDGVEFNLIWYDSRTKYPELDESHQFERWEIRVENLDHERREKLVDELNDANLSLNNIPFNIYSES